MSEQTRPARLPKRLLWLALAILIGLFVATETFVVLELKGWAPAFGGRIIGSIYVPWACIKWMSSGIISTQTKTIAASAGLVSAVLVFILPLVRKPR
ncbi:MAG: hypothetical protein IK051_05925 [Rhodocyclaceae bacterium]|nr:hypothetical protein [Rhodocyclaceae bacterium]